MKYLLILLLSLTNLNAKEDEKPNIVIILLDDMGYSDIGCFGGEIETPNIDQLAATGVRFNQFYNTGRCCPSRASLMTGMYSHQVGLPGMIPQNNFSNDCTTIAEALSSNGYRCIMSGKWHLGTRKGDNPWERGFDRFYGIPKGGGVYFWPSTLDRDIIRYDKEHGPIVTKPKTGFYSTDDFTHYAIAQIEEAKEDNVPFFLYLPYVAPHFPQQAKEQDIQKYLGRYKAGWEKLREERYQRQIEMGIISAQHELSPFDGAPWDSLSSKQQTAMDRQMAVYAAQMDNLDQNVGKILNCLSKQQLEDNTLVLFLSDNGGQLNANLGFEKNKKAIFGSAQSFGGYAKGWANMSNTPFRKFKITEHEGGNTSPLIARWPARIKNTKAICPQVSHIIDIMPTCLEIAGVKEDKLEGKSILPYLINPEKEPESRQLFWEHFGNRAVRIGDWKMVALKKKAWELYNMNDDRTELRNLIETHPERAKELLKAYKSWEARCKMK
ncbi:arylsulfatase [Lentisphaera marina]|uniref:arylsulfatase n=1 Tax=Lentisphaera marina TaxID=1111041 RepID=UPI0023667951|nr:arylsulfatase [Lentisphaera marina]MDD7983562.1 arylsulfatase [Lentisphaera marina]